MKKKILATLLAVCLFVGAAVPAVMAATSDVAGDAKKVKKITAEKDSYELEVGVAKDFADQIAVYEDDTKLVLDHNHIQYSLLANVGDSSEFEINGSEVTALKAGKTAKLTIFDNYAEKGRVTVTLKSVDAKASSTRKIESFTFSNSLNTIPVGNDAEDFKFTVEAHPKGTVFVKDDAGLGSYWSATDAVVKAIEAATDAAATKYSKTLGISASDITADLIDDGKKIEFTIPESALTGLDLTTANIKAEADDTNYVNGKDFTSTTSFRYVQAIPATGIFIGSELTVKVGEKIDLPKVTFYPSNANVGKGLDWNILAFKNDSEGFEYAVINDDVDKIIGVNSNTPSKVRLQAVLKNTNATTETIVNVKPASFSGKVTPFISKTSADMKVGGTMALEVKNLPQDVTVKAWSYDSKTAGIVDFTKWSGEKTTVCAKKVGDVTVKVTLSNDEVYTTTIKVAAASANNGGTTNNGGATNNPQTGDSLFANLF